MDSQRANTAAVPAPPVIRRALPPWVPVAVAVAGTGWGANQFTPMLLVYSRTLGLQTGTLGLLFAVYAVGLIPGLLIAGPVSDARGRRSTVVAAAAFSLAATVVIILGAEQPALLFVGRFAAGVSSGMVFSAGTSWLREASLPPFGSAGTATTARRGAMAMTIGFGAGPLVAGLLAQWAPAPAQVPYLPHVAVMIVALLGLLRAPETVGPESRRRVDFRIPEVRLRRFREVVAPLAPWVFAAPAICFAFLPEVLGAGHAPDGIALTALIPAVMTSAGVAVQPFAHRLGGHTGRNRAAITGLLVLSGGLVLGAVTTGVGALWLLVPCAIVLGAAYGLCLVAGLTEVQTLARPGGLAGLTAAFYALTYLGFAAPYLLTLAAPLAGHVVLLLATAALALATTAVVTVRSGADSAPRAEH